LHVAYLSTINQRLATFQQAWNNHNIRTEQQRTPEQLWLDGMLQHANSPINNSIFSDETEPVHQTVLQYCRGQFRSDGAIDSANNNISCVWQTEIGLSSQQLANLESSLSSSDSEASRYLQSISKIKEMLGRQDVQQ
jgi:hypothetical protein